MGFFDSIKHVVIAGIGFFSDAYDLFIINIVMTIIEAQFKNEPEVVSLF